MNSRLLALATLLALFLVTGCTVETSVTEPRDPTPASVEPRDPQVNVNVRNTMIPGEDDYSGEGKPALGWQQSGELVTGDHDKSFSMQQNFEPYAGVYTIQFGVIPPQDPLAPGVVQAFSAVADVSWSVAGSTVRRRVSIGNGVEISAPAQAVNVVVHDNSDPSVVAAGFSYVVFVQATPGPRASTGQPPTLLGLPSVTLVLPGAGLIVPIPQEAGAISVEVSLWTFAPGTTLIPHTISASLSTAGGAAIKTYDLSGQQTPIFVAIPPNATQIEIHNFTGTGGTTGPGQTVEVQVTWGIDG